MNSFAINSTVAGDGGTDEGDNKRFLTPLEDPQGDLRFLFRCLGIPVSNTEKKWLWKAYNIFVPTFLVCNVLYLVFYSTLESPEPYSLVAFFMFGLSSLLSYGIISWNSYTGRSILSLLRSVSANESNSYGRMHSTNQFLTTDDELQHMSRKWLSIVSTIGTLSYILIVVKDFGNDIYKISVALWVAQHISYVYFTVSWLLPVVLIRVSTHFMEKRILNFIVYVEGINDLRSARMEDLMDWYSDVYEMNKLLSDNISPLVTQIIIFLAPCVVFLLQGLLLQSFSVGTTFALAYWIAANVFVLYICAGSAAQVDVMNIRMEIAFASVSSTIQFASNQSISEYRLALAKIRAVPFGINFMGLRKRISYSDIWRITSIVGSVFIFMLTI